MNRRHFLEVSAGGIAASCLPALPLAPSHGDLGAQQMEYERAMQTTVLALGYTVGSGEPLPRERLERPLGICRRAIDTHEEARRLDPENVEVLQFLCHAQAGTSLIEVLAGHDPSPQLNRALSCAEEWARLRPDDPGAREAVSDLRSRIERLRATVPEEMLPRLLPGDILRWHRLLG